MSFVSFKVVLLTSSLCPSHPRTPTPPKITFPLKEISYGRCQPMKEKKTPKGERGKKKKDKWKVYLFHNLQFV